MYIARLTVGHCARLQCRDVWSAHSICVSKFTRQSPHTFNMS
jgi:hypothetical protein